MPLNDEPADRLRAAFEAHDLAAVLALMDEHVVWRGLDLPGQATALCQDRAEVAEVYRSAIARGHDGDPVILRVVHDSVVEDTWSAVATGPHQPDDMVTGHGGSPEHALRRLADLLRERRGKASG